MATLLTEVFQNVKMLWTTHRKMMGLMSPLKTPSPTDLISGQEEVLVVRGPSTVRPATASSDLAVQVDVASRTPKTLRMTSSLAVEGLQEVVVEAEGVPGEVEEVLEEVLEEVPEVEANGRARANE